MSDEQKRIDELVDLIKKQVAYSPSTDLLLYEELGKLSLKHGYLYGQALAAIKSAIVYKMLQNHQKYNENIQIAYAIASHANYADVLLHYYNEEGICLMENYEDSAALSMYLKGINLAVSVKDYRLGAIFYNNIAEIFYRNYDYDKALLYYLEAMKMLDLVINSEVNHYRKAILENIIKTYCFKKDVTQAKAYLKQFKQVQIEEGIRLFSEEEVEIRVLMLEQEDEKALLKVTQLLEEIKQCEVDDLLYYNFSFLCEVFLHYHQFESATFCIEQLEHMKMELSQQHVMDFLKLKIRYHQQFKIENEALYETFYKLTLELTAKNTLAVSDHLMTSVLLYENEKEKRLIKKEQEKLEDLVKIDPLTNVYNRRYFNQIIEGYLLDKSIKEIAYVMIDIDYFKEYNDLYGHLLGDETLQKVSSLLQRCLPNYAYLARYGGDEFACVLINQSVRQLDAFLKKVMEAMKQENISHKASGTNDYLTLSLGAYYCLNRDIIKLDELVKKADEALYSVKNKGRNGYLISHAG